VGFLSIGTPELSGHLVAAVNRGLAESGFVHGQNVTIVYRWARNDAGKLRELAAELVREQVSVIVTPAATPAVPAAKAATNSIPIVFSTGADPVRTGMVASLSNPGGNVTGVGGMTAEVGARRLGLLRELLPRATRFALLSNSSNPLSRALLTETRIAATGAGIELHVLDMITSEQVAALPSMTAQRAWDALMVAPDTLFINRRKEIAAYTLHQSVPSIFPFREDVEAGGLMSYGPSITDNARMAGVYVGRVLRGEIPANLPVVQPNKFEFAINLRSAKAIGTVMPPTLLARADEVIE
jgi:putative ABC transport system substrate-binding protein